MNPDKFNIDLPDSRLQSQVISFLRFPLIVAVLMIHSNPEGIVSLAESPVEVGATPVFTYTRYLISEVISQIAVPLFYFISGFLFFKGCTSSFPREAYARKLKSRARTLLVPYIFWNAVVLALTYSLHTFFPEMTSGTKTPFTSYTFLDWLMAFWNYDGGMPINFPFWFLRDLMVTMLLSPLLYAAIRYTKWVFPVILGILWITDTWFDLTGLSIDALFFFSAGAYYRIIDRNFLKEMRPYMKVSLALYILLCALCLIYNLNQPKDWLVRLSIIVGMVATITLTGHCISRKIWKVNPFLTESSFFLYAYHCTVLSFIIKIHRRLILIDTDMELLGLYIIAPLETIFIGLTLYYLLREYLPRFTAIITGGR